MSTRRVEEPGSPPPKRVATRVVAVDAENPDPAVLDLAAGTLLRGGLVAFATETVYGLGAVATDPDSVGRIFAAKGRPAANPLIVHVAAIAQARECTADWPDTAERLARRFWPGPLSLVLLRSPIIPDVVTAGRETAAIRAPAGKIAQGLIERLGKPIAAPSANRSNRISPTRAEHVLADLGGLVDLVLDSGPTAIGLESTVLDLTSSPPLILRPGPISPAEIEAELTGEPVAVRPLRVETQGLSRAPGRPASPGQMPVHYAPTSPAFRVERPVLVPPAISESTAVIVIGETGELAGVRSDRMFRLETPELAARSLYDILHQCDALGVATILVVMPPDLPDWQAIRDRLLRATKPLGRND
jgi:L-threonylcarbamoyladenylate synthase